MIIKLLKIGVPFLILAAGAFGAFKIIEMKPEVETAPPARVVPSVRVVPVEKQSLQFRVRSQGTVMARTETSLIPEVSGRVTYVSPSLTVGGFFEEGDVLLRVDSHDYELGIIRARSEIAQARLRLEQERAEAKVALAEWTDLGDSEEASPLVLREPQLMQAEAALEAAEANLRQAERDLERTEIRAPFPGRVRRKSVDIGQFISRGAAVAQLYSVEVAEVRLPLPDQDLAFVRIPLSYRGEEAEQAGPKVLLKATFAGREHTWEGRIVRTEGEIDAASRMLYAVAQVDDPYAQGEDPERPPLAVGMFVEAEILGRWANDVVVLPREALRGTDTVYVIDPEGILHMTQVDILRQERERIVIKQGLDEGSKVCISPMETVVDGMTVRAIENSEVPS